MALTSNTNPRTSLPDGETDPPEGMLLTEKVQEGLQVLTSGRDRDL